MRRYWIEKKMLQDNQVHFSGEIFHHIFDVCRQKVGSKFEVLNEDSKAFLVEVVQIHKKEAFAQILEERFIPLLPDPKIHIALSISRFPVMDAIIEKAVEMGVFEIHPFFSEFSFLRTGEKLSPQKKERWDKIVVSATQQSGRGELMKVHAPQELDKVLMQFQQADSTLGLFAYEGQATLGIKEALKNLRTAFGPVPVQNIWIFVGSEGGFSYQEVEVFRQKNLEPVTIGSQVLRVETACIALIAAIKYEFDLLQ